MKKQILVTKSSMPPYEEYIEAIKPLWDSHWLTNMGENHNRLQKDLTEYLGVANLSLFVNGHMALELGLQSLGLTGEVITTPFTFASTTHAIVRNGMNPIFCDINEDDYTIDCTKLESLITKQTTAILPVHVYGNICDVERIEEIAQKYHLKVIYDAAHAFGVKYKNIGIGNFGDLSIFSFHATKVFNTIEGGAVCYHEKKIGDLLYQLKNFGIESAEIVNGIGANGKMNEFQASMGLCNLRYIDENIQRRKKIYNRYIRQLGNIEGMELPTEQENVIKNYSYFPVLIKENFGKGRDRVYEELCSKGIYVRKYFYPLTSAFGCYRNRFNEKETPVALRISEQILTLPIYPDLQEDEVDYICDSIQMIQKNI